MGRGMMGGGMMSRGMMAGCIVRSVNTVMGDFLADAEALLAVRLERVSLDDIAPTHSTRRPPCNDEPC